VPTRLSLPPGGIRAVALGDETTCVASTSGQVSCIGLDDFGSLGQADAALDTCTPLPSAVAAGFIPRRPGPCSRTWRAVKGLEATEVMTLSAGDGFFCALDAAAHGWCWGVDTHRQTGPTPPAARARTRI
jgi:hypothetical protein